MRSLALLFALSGTSLAQVPQGVTASENKQHLPQLLAEVNWQPPTDANGNPIAVQIYKIYKEVATLSDCPTNGWVLEDTRTSTSYLDNPFPDWYKVPVTGDWRSREWCYAVSAIVNGNESAKSAGSFVAIGDSGYLNLTFKNVCGGPNIVPFPYMGDTIAGHFYYTDGSGVDHEFAAIHLYNAYPYPAGDPQHSYNEEWEWKLPTIALDGTVVPWDRNGKYTYSLRTPDGGYASDWFSPRYQLDASYYNQISLSRIPNSAYNDWCPIDDGPGGNYSYWQNVTR